MVFGKIKQKIANYKKKKENKRVIRNKIYNIHEEVKGNKKSFINRLEQHRNNANEEKQKMYIKALKNIIKEQKRILNKSTKILGEVPANRSAILQTYKNGLNKLQNPTSTNKNKTSSSNNSKSSNNNNKMKKILNQIKNRHTIIKKKTQNSKWNAIVKDNPGVPHNMVINMLQKSILRELKELTNKQTRDINIYLKAGGNKNLLPNNSNSNK